MTTNSVIDFDSFMRTDGIYESTILDFYESQIFFMGRESIHILFFNQLMDDDASCVALQQILFDLVVGLFKAYKKHVSSTTGDLDKRMKSGKLMMIHFENDRCLLRSTQMSKFIHLPLVEKLFNEPQNEEINRCVSEQSRLIFCYIEDFLYKNFWKWHHFSRGLHVDNFITERSTDTNYDYSPTMLHKVYDITGYLCGHRLFNLIHLNRLRHEYIDTFQNFYSFSRHTNGATALLHGLPAQGMIFREHSEGLYYSKGEIFEFIKIVMAIWMQSLSTDVLILFNSFEPADN
jgi:hypothetical protein